MNFILDTDSYKLSHFLGYPADATHMYSYAESRGGKYPATVFFGLQKFLRELAAVRITYDDICEAKEFANMHGVPFNKEGWMRIHVDHDGRIPVRIKAVAEGTVVPTRNVLVTVENTDPTMPWLTSYIETALLRAVWYPTTVATRIHRMKQRIKPYYDSSSDTADMGFGILDFSARGVSSRETAEVGGLAHLISFVGSDNIPAVLAARKYYDEPMAAFSVAATEHSIMTAYGHDHELESFEYLIENMMPQNGILSVVSDTWNVFEAAEKWVSLAERVRNKNGTLVVRPDSGLMQQVLPRLFDTLRGFGVVRNSKGYDVLQNVKVLQGDGIDEETVTVPFDVATTWSGISADSVMTGSGGGLMQANIDRDTLKFAFKASNVTRAGVDYPISKDPITDPGKRSKMGRLKLVEYGEEDGVNSFTTLLDDGSKFYQAHQDSLRTVYENGELFNVEDFNTIRARLASYL